MILITPSDRFAIFGATGMVGSAISRALYRSGYYQQLKPSRQELDLLNPMAVQQWFGEHHPSVVVLTAAKVAEFMQKLLIRRIFCWRISRSRPM